MSNNYFIILQFMFLLFYLEVSLDIRGITKLWIEKIRMFNIFYFLYCLELYSNNR